jgi:hypothetical protein
LNGAPTVAIKATIVVMAAAALIAVADVCFT